MSKITNSDARTYVLRKEEFTTINKTIFGKYYEGDPLHSIPPIYAVFSYGEHFPMYVYDYEACQWYGNQDKYSRTTTKHQSQTRPHSIAQWVDTSTLKRIIYRGVVNAVAQRMS